MLADYALAHPDGKLYITGGGLGILRVPAVPYTIPHVSLAAVVEFDSAECGRPHSLRIKTAGPGGDPFLRDFEIWLLPRQVADAPDMPILVPMVYNVENVLLPRAGRYALSLVWPTGSYALPDFGVVKVEQPGSEDWTALNNLGKLAWANEQLEEALEAFRNVTRTHPGFAESHNNLGFVLLELGRPDEAKQAFIEAQRLSFEHPELLEANMACCEYLLGHADIALNGFSACYRVRSMPGPASLFELAGDQLRRRRLASAGDYAELMASNAAWSAYRAGLVDDARTWLEAASASARATGSELPGVTELRRFLPGP